MKETLINFSRMRWYTSLYYLSLLLVMVSIPLSKYTTSMFQFSLLSCWLLHDIDWSFSEEKHRDKRHLLSSISRATAGFFGAILRGFINKFRQFLRNRTALIISSLFLLHVIGLANTTDFHYAFKDLRTKLPVFILPLFISTGPKVSTRMLYLFLAAYVIAVFGGSLYRLALFLNLPLADPRAIYAHTSHIRFSLNAVFAVFIALRLASGKEAVFPLRIKISLAIIALWLALFMVYMHYSTGIALMIIVAVAVLVQIIVLHTGKRVRVVAGIAGIILVALPVFYVLSVAREYRSAKPVSFGSLEKYTANGNSYYHDTVNFRIEGGKWVGLYICDKELRAGWKKLSNLPIDSLDRKQQPIRFTLIRYLASMDRRKDSAGLAGITKEDVSRIEGGMVNMTYAKGFSLRGQINQYLISFDTYRATRNANMGSLVQRIEFWRTALQIISQHPVAGVGTGDVPAAFDKEYRKMNSLLEPGYRLRSHNQYLSITVAFGIIGLLWFLFVLVYPAIKTGSVRNYFFYTWWIILCVSMLTEDTIESQEGVTFFAFFITLFLTGLLADIALPEGENKA